MVVLMTGCTLLMCAWIKVLHCSLCYTKGITEQWQYIHGAYLLLNLSNAAIYSISMTYCTIHCESYVKLHHCRSMFHYQYFKRLSTGEVIEKMSYYSNIIRPTIPAMHSCGKLFTKTELMASCQLMASQPVLKDVLNVHIISTEEQTFVNKLRVTLDSCLKI